MSLVVYSALCPANGDDEEFFATRIEAQARAKEMAYGCKAEVIRYVGQVGMKPIDRALAMLNGEGWYMMALTMDVYDSGVKVR